MNDNDETNLPSEDIPLTPQSINNSTKDDVPISEIIQREEQKHAFAMDEMRNNAAIVLILFALFILTIIVIIQAIMHETSSVNAFVELLKTITTVSVGYLFGTKSRN